MAEAYRKFASYLLFKEILVDDLGHLYRAGEIDRSGLKRTVWLRIVDSPAVPSAEMIDGFARARRVAAAVQSSHVARGVEFVADDDVPAFACDFVAAQPLSLVFERMGAEGFPVSVDNALLVLEKIALALSAALTVEIDGSHVVHGFLHPGLIFISNDGEGVVSGFGLGEQLLNAVDEPGSEAGIHPYIAPEVLLSHVPSRRGDVYSMGSILFQLITGSPLPSRPEQRRRALEEAQLADDQAPIPNDIRELLSRALAEQPGERFSSAADFKTELDRLLYGGAYSPTTFNLALFMDRLFRAEAEVFERERTQEAVVEVGDFFSPAPEPILEEPAESEAATPRARKPLLWALAAAVVVAVVVGVALKFGVGFSNPPPTPTPTAEEIALQRQAQEQKMRELAEGLVREMMAEKEEEIRQELLERQNKIEELQKRLQDSERRARSGQLSGEEQQKQAELARQIAAEEEARRKREAELEAERQRAEEEARQQAAAQQAATATAAAEEQAKVAAAVLEPTLTPTVAPVDTPLQQAAPSAASAVAIAVAENSFFEPSQVDTLPVVLKKAPVSWSRTALYSRRKGVVIVQATVNANGQVEDVKVLRSDNDGFGIPQAVIEAVRKYRFKPGMKNGVKIKTYATVTLPYHFVVR